MCYFIFCYSCLPCLQQAGDSQATGRHRQVLFVSFVKIFVSFVVKLLHLFKFRLTI